MSEDGFQERTEDPTPKHKRERREKGEVVRSRELNTALVVIASGLGLWAFCQALIETIEQNFKIFFTQSRYVYMHMDGLVGTINTVIINTTLALLPIFIVSIIAVFTGPLLVGGWSFSRKIMAPKASRMNPLKGLKRMASLKSLVELVKAVAKFVVISLIGFFVIKYFMEDFLTLTRMPVVDAIYKGMRLSLEGFITVSMGLIVIAAIDVPYQIFENLKKIRMTKQEVREEMKETEGKPEVKSQIRRVQQEMANARMMDKVPLADAIITNPSHYSVAIRYDKLSDAAPVVVARGRDQLALRIRKIAKENTVPILTAPPLARAIYHTTKLDHQVPTGLYVALAQVLAYVYQLKTTSTRENLNHLRAINLPEEYAQYQEVEVDHE